MTSRILFVAETEIAYLGMERCLSKDGFIFVGGLHGPVEAVVGVKQESPDMVLVWATTSEITGFSVCRDLSASTPHVAVVLFVIEPDSQLVADAAYARTRACLDAQSPCYKMRRAIQVVANGGTLFTAEELDAARLVEPLTQREIDVVGLAAEQLTLDESAERLGTRPATVRNQLAEARAKLNVRSTQAAVARTRRRGLIVS